MIPIHDVKEKYGTSIAVVLLCCRLHFDTEQPGTLQQYINDYKIDWDDVIYLSGYHRIEPIVYTVLSKATLPASVASRVKQHQFALVQKNFTQALETERLIGLLESSGIRCVPYKGVAFSMQFYGNIISRESSDIDLVVSHSDFPKVLELMTTDGYIFENEVEYNHFKDKIFNKNNSLNFNKYELGVRKFHIEFHWRITENFVKIHKQAHAQLFRNSNTITLAKREVNALNVNAHYITVFIHHSNHDGFRVLRNIVDLCQINLSNHPGIQLQYINDAFTTLRLVRAAATCCYLSSELLGIQPAFSAANQPIQEKIKAYFIGRLLGKRSYRDNALDNLDNRSQLYLKDSASEKIEFIFAGFRQRILPSQEDLRSFNLHPYLHFLYPVLKPFRLLTRGFDKKNIKKKSNS